MFTVEKTLHLELRGCLEDGDAGEQLTDIEKVKEQLARKCGGTWWSTCTKLGARDDFIAHHPMAYIDILIARNP